MLLKYLSTRGLCVHLQIFWFVDMFPKSIKKWTYPEWAIETPPFLAFWNVCYTDNRTSSSVLPRVPLIWKRSVKAEGRGRRLGRRSWYSRRLGRDLGPGPFSSGSARGRELWQCPPLIAVLKMAVYVVLSSPIPLKHFTHVLVVSCDFWLGGPYLFSK